MPGRDGCYGGGLREALKTKDHGEVPGTRRRGDSGKVGAVSTRIEYISTLRLCRAGIPPVKNGRSKPDVASRYRFTRVREQRIGIEREMRQVGVLREFAIGLRESPASRRELLVLPASYEHRDQFAAPPFSTRHHQLRSLVVPSIPGRAFGGTEPVQFGSPQGQGQPNS